MKSPASTTYLSFFFIFIPISSMIVLTFYPGIQSGESPILVTATQSLGISHAPGYPLYIQVCRFFSLVPIGSLIYRHVLFSLFASGIVCFLLVRISHALIRSTGLFACSFLVTSAAFVENCLKTEVYALALVFFCLMLFFVHTWQSTNDDRWLLALAFLSGLACGHHLTIVMLIPVFVFCSGLRWWPRFSFRFFLLIVFFAIMGFSVLLYLPLRAGGYPLINWGVPLTFERFVTLISAREEVLPSMGPRFTIEGILLNLQEMKISILRDLAWYLIAPAIFGVITIFRRSRLFFSISVMSFLFLLAAVTLYQTNERGAFFLPGLCVFAIWFDIGIVELSRGLVIRLKQQTSSSTRLLFSISILLIAITVGSHQAALRNWLSKDDVPFFFEMYCRGIASETSAGACVLTERSNLYFMMLYNTIVEHDGPYTPVFRHLLSFPWYLGILPYAVPIAHSDSINDLAEDSKEWNDIISAALLANSSRRSDAYVIEPFHFDGPVLGHFPGLSCLLPRGFLFRIAGGSCQDTRMSAAYRWLSEYCNQSPMKPLHANFFAYVHSRQKSVLKEMDCLAEAHREHVWMKSLLTASHTGQSSR